MYQAHKLRRAIAYATASTGTNTGTCIVLVHLGTRHSDAWARESYGSSSVIGRQYRDPHQAKLPTSLRAGIGTLGSGYSQAQRTPKEELGGQRAP